MIDDLKGDRSPKQKIYFYKINNPYGCFSNFSPHSIELAGDLMVEIQTAPTPEIAAQIGRKPEHQPHSDWEHRKLEVMYRAIFHKFTTHLSIRAILIETEDAEIIEDSPRDYFWGCGIEGNGTNHLGRILMEVRDELKILSQPPPYRGS
jgi:predicted NAD-dependent protein-ADP-ribosyltransferase YbiA (DUF1768 family)